MFSIVLQQWDNVLLLGLLATVVMTALFSAGRMLGLSRLSVPFLFGTFFTVSRFRANTMGLIFFVVGGWVFSLFYFPVFAGTGLGTWWTGALLGLAHGVIFLIAIATALPYFHPRMASQYHGPSAVRQIEPPGMLGMNYGILTPLVTLAAFVFYGMLLGGLHQLFN